MSGRLFLLAILVVLLPSAPAVRAQEQGHRGVRVRPEADQHEGPLWTGSAISLDPGGLRSELAEQGFALSLDVIHDSSWPLDGGLRQRRTGRTLVDVALEVDLERVAGLPGATLFAEVYSLAGRDASADVGDIQAFSNIDGEHVTQLAELWLEHVSAGGDVRLKAGKLDANSEFAYVDAGLGFLHSSAGYSPTVFPLPTYPDPAVSLNVFARPAPGWQVGLGMYNARDGGTVSGRRGLSADFEAAFLIGQITRSGDAGEDRLALGLWHHTGDFARFDGGTESGAEGAYALLEKRLWRERPGAADDRQGLVGFLQWGVADDELSAFETHVGVGLVCTGLLPRGDSWETGLYLSHVELSDAPAAGLGGTELAIELFQELRLTPSLTLKPDLQLIVDPSGSNAIDDAWVATLRLELSL